jgi:glycosyltransferase involved in cell wall biosynthesis
MTVSPLLCILIPTFNRERCLALSLGTLVEQIRAGGFGPEQVSVLVLDNASTDGTAALVAGYGDLPHLGYRRNESNIGAEPNVELAYQLSPGRYTWVFGDDDLMLPGCLARVLAELEGQRWGGLCLNYAQYDRDLKEPMAERVLPVSEDRSFGGMAEFLALPGALDGVASISSFLFRTDLARAVDIGHYFGYRSYYGHIALLSEALATAAVRVIGEILLIQRQNNQRYPPTDGMAAATFNHSWSTFLSAMRMFADLEARGIMPLARLEEIRDHKGASIADCFIASCLTRPVREATDRFEAHLGGEIVALVRAHPFPARMRSRILSIVPLGQRIQVNLRTLCRM